VLRPWSGKVLPSLPRLQESQSRIRPRRHAGGTIILDSSLKPGIFIAGLIGAVVLVAVLGLLSLKG
jgi:hypothetical protein